MRNYLIVGAVSFVVGYALAKTGKEINLNIPWGPKIKIG